MLSKEFAEFTESPVPTLHALAVSKAYHCYWASLMLTA